MWLALCLGILLNRLVVALDEQSRISIGRLEALRNVQERDTLIAELQQQVAQMKATLAIVEQRENLLAGELGRALQREAALQEKLQEK